MNSKFAMVLTCVMMPLFGCRAEPPTNLAVNVRLCINTPDNRIHTLADAKYARWEEERHRSGDGSTPFQGIVLTERQISEVIQIITDNQTVPWARMTAETPYPRSEVAILVYRPQEGGWMCSLGSGDRVRRVLEQIIARIPKEQRFEVQKSLEAIGTTQQPARGDGKPAPQP